MNKNKKDERLYLNDIITAILKIHEYTEGGKDHFFKSTLVQDGVIRQLSIIGEAAAKLSLQIKELQPEIPWKSIIGMRNIIIHDYSDISINRVWDTVQKDLNPLENAIKKIIADHLG